MAHPALETVLTHLRTRSKALRYGRELEIELSVHDTLECLGIRVKSVYRAEQHIKLTAIPEVADVSVVLTIRSQVRKRRGQVLHRFSAIIQGRSDRELAFAVEDTILWTPPDESPLPPATVERLNATWSWIGPT